MNTKEEVINALRACLVSSKDPIPESAISRDYLSLVGSPIPFVRLGFTSLRSFLTSEDCFILTKSRDGQYLVSAKPDEETGHISLLVSRQKRSSRRGVRVRYRGAPPPRHARARPPPPLLGHRTQRPALVPTPRPALLPTPRTFSGAGFGAGPATRTSSSYNTRLGNPPVVPQRQCSLEEQVRPKQTNAPARVPAPTSWNHQTQLPDRLVEEEQGRLIVTVPATTSSLKDGTLGERVKSSVIKWLSGSQKNSKKKLHRERMSGDAGGSQKFQRELASLSAQLNFPEPTYRTNWRKPSNGAPQWCATVYIGDASFNSFPEERAREEEAKELAAEQACKDFRKRLELIQGTVERLSPMQEALKLIEEMVNSKPNGIFSDHIEAEYLEKYGQRLPSYWCEEGAADMVFEMDKMAGNRFILYPVSPEKKQAYRLNNNVEINGRISAAAAEPKKSTLSRSFDLFASSNSIDGVVESMNKLDLPADDNWDVYVTSASSPGQVWVRLIGEEYDGMYDVVLTEMELLMMDKKREAPKPIKVNGYYSVYLDKCWLRAQVTEIIKSESSSEEDSVDIFLIDIGEIDTVPISSLYILEPMFSVLPAQAIRCRLALAEVLGEGDSVWPLLLEQVGRSFVAEVVERGNDSEDHAIVLYDTSVDPPVDVNAKLLKEAFANLAPPRLPLKGGVTEVLLGSISVNGPVYVTACANAFKWVHQILEDLEACKRIAMKDEFRPKPSHLRNPKANCMFLAKSKDSPDQWSRATLVEAAVDLRTVDLFFVDYGNVETIPTPDILLLDRVCPELCKVPKQAIMVELDGIPSHKISSEVVSYIRQLAPLKKPLLGKVVEAGNGDQHPVLSLFFRVPPNNILASVNDNVLLTVVTSEPYIDPKTERADSRTGSISGKVDSRNGNTESRTDRLESSGRLESNGRLESKSERLMVVNGSVESRNDMPVNGVSRLQDEVAPVLCRGLTAPPIPEVGKEFFQVYVPLASNPDLFVVQPCSSFSQRQEMMTQLQKVCNSNSLLPPTEIQERNLYAARNKDKKWYRVSVVRKDKDLYTVYMCDFGDMTIIPAKDFLCLDDQFRKLPYQAIRAKLTGIKPVNVNWSTEDCKEFQNKVVNEWFQAQVTEKAPDLPDLLNCQDSILGLKLLDTRDATKDICIADWLVEKGRARKI